MSKDEKLNLVHRLEDIAIECHEDKVLSDDLYYEIIDIVDSMNNLIIKGEYK